MALAGVHIAFGSATIGIAGGSSGEALPFLTTGSSTMSSPGTSSVSATDAPDGRKPMVSINASAPIFYAVGPNPDAINGPRRYYDPSFGREDIFVNSGDKFAWVFA